MDFNAGKLFDFERGFSIFFDKVTGLSPDVETGKRSLSQMKGMYLDSAAEEAAITAGDPIVYEFHGLPATETDGNFNFGCSIVNPGLVGNEYYMTKGHFHNVIDTGEVYYCLSGHGYMLMENPEGDWSAIELLPGRVSYVPPCYAHRSICVGENEKLVTFFVYRADAGHDYGSIETKGFRKLMVKGATGPEIIDNPRWK